MIDGFEEYGSTASEVQGSRIQDNVVKIHKIHGMGGTQSGDQDCSKKMIRRFVVGKTVS